MHIIVCLACYPRSETLHFICIDDIYLTSFLSELWCYNWGHFLRLSLQLFPLTVHTLSGIVRRAPLSVSAKWILSQNALSVCTKMNSQTRSLSLSYQMNSQTKHILNTRWLVRQNTRYSLVQCVEYSRDVSVRIQELNLLICIAYSLASFGSKPNLSCLEYLCASSQSLAVYLPPGSWKVVF